VASATSASRSHESAATGSAGASPATQPAADITAITTRDDLLLELGQTLGGQASVRPVDSLEAALEAMARGKRGQVLVVDARDVANVRAAVDAVHAAALGVRFGRAKRAMLQSLMICRRGAPTQGLVIVN